MHISFSTSNEIRGHCIDHADNSNCGTVSDISGSWEAKVDQGVVIRFAKTFWGGQKSVDYTGEFTQDFKRIIAHWAPIEVPPSPPPSSPSPPPPPPLPPQGILSTHQWFHHFKMDFEYGSKLEKVWWRCSQECAFDCCNGCMEKYTVQLCPFLDVEYAIYSSGDLAVFGEGTKFRG